MPLRGDPVPVWRGRGLARDRGRACDPRQPEDPRGHPRHHHHGPRGRGGQERTEAVRHRGGQGQCPHPAGQGLLGGEELTEIHFFYSKKVLN